MARTVQEEGDLYVDVERVDLGELCFSDPLDEDTLCVGGNMDLDDLDTEIGDASSVAGPVYRADTTLITADNTSLSADYRL
jgi:hypothetical protein